MTPPGQEGCIEPLALGIGVGTVVPGRDGEAEGLGLGMMPRSEGAAGRGVGVEVELSAVPGSLGGGRRDFICGTSSRMVHHIERACRVFIVFKIDCDLGSTLGPACE